MKNARTQKHNIFFVALGVLFAIILYEIFFFATRGKFVPEFFYAFGQAITLLGSTSFLISFGYTLLRTLIGFLLSLFLGLSFGLFAGYYARLSSFLSPLVSILRSVPRIAVIFLLALYVPHFYLAVVFLLCFPIAYEASRESVYNCCNRFRNEFALEGNKGRKNIIFVCLPLSVPDFLCAARQCLGLSFKAEIRAETFGYTSSFRGLGKNIYRFYQDGDFTSLTEYILILLVFCILIDLLLSFLRNKIRISSYSE